MSDAHLDGQFEDGAPVEAAAASLQDSSTPLSLGPLFRPQNQEYPGESIREN
jgi:hypothetical protein